MCLSLLMWVVSVALTQMLKFNHNITREDTFIEKCDIRFSTWYRLNSYCIQIKHIKYSNINSFWCDMCILIYAACLDLGVTQPEHELLTNTSVSFQKLLVEHICLPDIMIFGLQRPHFLSDSWVMIHTILKPKV